MNRRLTLLFRTAALISAIFLGSTPAAFATPTSQGGTDGVLFMSEATDGTIYVGDILNPTTAKTVFWHADDSSVDEVAVTETRIGWASYLAAGAGPLANKVFISDLGTTAGTITEATLPDAGRVTALAADLQGERFYATQGNKIYAIDSDGSSVVVALTDASVSGVTWGLWADGYNHRLYYCANSNLYGADLNNDGTASNLTTIFTGTNPSCDGMGIDPVAERMYMASYNSSPKFSWANADGSGSVTEIVPTDPMVGGAPSSMFVSHDTHKIYFATEPNVYEINFDGTGLRLLYSGTHNSWGFENIAVAYGVTLDNIGDGGSGGSGGGGDNGGSGNHTSGSLAFTGFDPLLPAGGAVLLVLVGLVIVIRRRTT